MFIENERSNLKEIFTIFLKYMNCTIVFNIIIICLLKNLRQFTGATLQIMDH